MLEFNNNDSLTMKALKLWAIVALLCIVSAVSFYAGRDYEAIYGQSYEDASKMSDLIRCYEDIVPDDSLFLELQDEFLDNIELSNYTYCY